MVSFTENPENYDSVLTAKHIDSQLSACMALERKLNAFDREMALDPRYVHRVSAIVIYIDWVLLFCVPCPADTGQWTGR